MTNTANKKNSLCLKEIIELRDEILVMHRRTGESIESCGAFIEAAMDGTQNPTLITEAIASANANKPVSKILRVKREMYVRNAILIEAHRTGQTAEEAASWIGEICDDKYKPHFEAGKRRAIEDEKWSLDLLMQAEQIEDM